MTGDPESPLPQPWDADHEMDEAQVARVLAEAAPEMAGREVSRLGEGWDFRAFEAGGDVFRFPKRADVAADMARECGLLAALGPRLPLPVPAASVHAPSEHAPHGFMRWPKLPGVPLSSVELPRAQARWVGACLGGFLSALHAVPVREARALGAREFGWDEPASRSRRTLARLRAIEAHLPKGIAPRAARILGEPPRAGAGELSLIHSDFWPEHLLVDPGSLEPTGVIDWGDAETGDPAWDLAGLWYLGGDEALHAGLARWEHRQDAELVARCRFFGVVHAVGDAWYARERGLPRYLAGAAAALQRLP